MTVRVGLIGAGVMGSDHARVISEDIPGATLQVVCDASRTAAERVAEAFDADAETDSLALIKRADVDAVLIASPDGTHADLTLAAIEERKPVLCEKPLAETTTRCLEVVAAEAALGRQLVQVGFMRRFDPPYVEMRDCLGAGRIGSAVMMHNFHRNVETPAADFTSSMAITNSAPHEFDAIRYVLDVEVTAISAFEPTRSDLEAAKPVVMVLETSAGQLAMVEINNNAAYGYDVRGELVGTRGSFALGGPVSGVCNAALMASNTYPTDWRPRFAEAYRLQDKAWINGVLAGEVCADAASAWDGYCATAIAEAGVKALATGQKAEVVLAVKPGLYDRQEAAA